MLANFLANIGCDRMDFEDINLGAFIKSNRELNRMMLKDKKNGVGAPFQGSHHFIFGVMKFF